MEIGTETPIFLFWEYLFRNFGILSLQCAAFVLGMCEHFNFLPAILTLFYTRGLGIVLLYLVSEQIIWP